VVDWRGDLEEARRVVDDVRYNARNRNGTVAKTQWDRLGAVSDYIGGVLALNLVEGEVVEPSPEPGRPRIDPIATLRGFTAPKHWDGSPEGYYAIDWYPDPDEQGLSEDIPIAWPVGGVVRRAGMMGPMVPRAGHDGLQQDHWKDVPEGKAALWRRLGYQRYGNEVLWTAILDADNGVSYAFTHVRQDIYEGRAEAGEVFAWVDSSGIGMFRAAGLQPAHIHLACYRGAPTTWQGGIGNLVVLDEIRRLGFQVRVVSRIPSPMDYLQRRAKAGKFL